MRSSPRKRIGSRTSDDEESLPKALELDPRQAQAAIGLGRILLERGDTEEARELLAHIPHDFVADGLDRSRSHSRPPQNGAEAGRTSGGVLSLGRR